MSSATTAEAPRVLLDTNVVLDVLLQGEPWLAEAQEIWQAIDDERLTAYLPASVLTDIFYVARRLTDSVRARQAVQVFLDAFEIAAVDRSVLERAKVLAGANFEDNVQIACAELNQLEAIVTRDLDDYAGSPIPVWSPDVCRRHLTGPREPRESPYDLCLLDIVGSAFCPLDHLRGVTKMVTHSPTFVLLVQLNQPPESKTPIFTGSF